MGKVIRLSDSDLENINDCLVILKSQDYLVDVCGFKPDVKFVITAALNCYKGYITDKLKEGLK